MTVTRGLAIKLIFVYLSWNSLMMCTECGIVRKLNPSPFPKTTADLPLNSTRNETKEIVIELSPVPLSSPEISSSTSSSSSKDEDEQYYIYYPLGIVNGTLSVIGSPVVYKVGNSNDSSSSSPSLERVTFRRRKRQIGLNTADALLGGALGGGLGGLVGGTVLSPYGPLGSAIGGGVGAGVGAAIGAGLAGGGPGGFLLGGAGGATLGSIGGLVLGPTGATVLGLIGGAVGGALGSIG